MLKAVFILDIQDEAFPFIQQLVWNKFVPVELSFWKSILTLTIMGERNLKRLLIFGWVEIKGKSGKFSDIKIPWNSQDLMLFQS